MENLTVKMHRFQTVTGLIYIFLQIFILPVILVVVNSFLPNPLSDAALNFSLFAINFICVTVIFHSFLIDSFWVFLKHPKQILRTCLTGFGLYWLGSILVNTLVIFLDPNFSNVNDENIAVLTEQNIYLMAIGTVVLVPVVEETLYRGVIFGQLYRRNHVLGYVVSVAVFSLLHILGYVGYFTTFRLFLCFLQYIPAGLFLAWSYVKANTIWAPVLIHMTVNLIGMIAM